MAMKSLNNGELVEVGVAIGRALRFCISCAAHTNHNQHKEHDKPHSSSIFHFCCTCGNHN